jgi:hypothetical protein
MESPYWRRCAGMFVVHDKPSTAGVGREGFRDLSLLGGPARPLPVQQVGGAGVWAARQHDLRPKRLPDPSKIEGVQPDAAE